MAIFEKETVTCQSSGILGTKHCPTANKETVWLLCRPHVVLSSIHPPHPLPQRLSGGLRRMQERPHNVEGHL